MSTEKIVDASPTKEFFIYMITRDIQTNAAIVELVDNAIDGAKRLRKDGNYEGLKIEVTFDKDRFIIKDNCGGIDIETATKYAFKFGRPTERENQQGYYTGIFGIGMKRALFKLGRKFKIISTTSTEHFVVDIDVDDWIKKEEWQFDMYDIQENQEYPEEQWGTEIVIEELNSEQKYNFMSKIFENQLHSYIEKYRSVETEKGLQIILNSQVINFFKEQLIETDEIRTYKNYIEDETGRIRIVAGISHYGDPEKAGWYIMCNGRMVVFADKSSLTGWGSEYRSYHPVMAPFRGYVFFESKDLLSLPWNTTKTGVDVTNRLYMIAKEKMKEAVEQIGRVISEKKSQYDIDNLDELPCMKSAKTVCLDHNYIVSISSNSDFEITEKSPLEEVTTVSFKELKVKVEAAKKHAKVSNKTDLGKKIFNYYWDMEEL